MKNLNPLISCICITKNRVSSLKQAISCYLKQDYPTKELVISYPKSDLSSKKYLKEILDAGVTSIILIERSDELSLGAARNNAISNCNGEFMCNWDDDDWYHPLRLSAQFKTMSSSIINFEASVLNQVLIYDKINKNAYLSFLYPWESTLMCKVSLIIQIGYADKNIGEDSNIIDYLDATKSLCHVADAAYLYIYTYHTENTWNRKHFESFFVRSVSLNQITTDSIIKILELETN